MDANRVLLAAGASDGDSEHDAVSSCVRVRELDWHAPSCDASATTSAAADDDDNKWRWTAADRELCVPLSLRAHRH